MPLHLTNFLIGIGAFFVFVVMALIIYCAQKSNHKMCARITKIICFLGWLAFLAIMWAGIAFVRSTGDCYEGDPATIYAIIGLSVIAILATMSMFVCSKSLWEGWLVRIALVVFGLSMVALMISILVLWDFGALYVENWQENSTSICGADEETYEKGM
jgi:hypothetical protein